MELIRDLNMMEYLNWSKSRGSSGTAGTFLKAEADYGDGKKYYKLSNFSPNRGVFGHECCNELIVDRLLSLLGVEHLDYRLILAIVEIGNVTCGTYLCESDDFKKPGESKIAFDLFYHLEKQDYEDSVIEFCRNMGWSDYIWQMIVVDFLILNRDRHGANIEVLRSADGKSLRLAPLFDHGLSLLFDCHTDEEIEAFDVMKDRPVQSIFGSRSVKDNLKLIPAGEEPEFNKLKQSDRDFLFEGFRGIISELHQDKIWEMIWKRWKYYEKFCNKRRLQK